MDAQLASWRPHVTPQLTSDASAPQPVQMAAQIRCADAATRARGVAAARVEATRQQGHWSPQTHQTWSAGLGWVAWTVQRSPRCRRHQASLHTLPRGRLPLSYGAAFDASPSSSRVLWPTSPRVQLPQPRALRRGSALQPLPGRLQLARPRR